MRAVERFRCGALLLVAMASMMVFGETETTDTPAPATNTVTTGITNAAATNITETAEATQRLYLQLQEQLHTALLAIEQNKKDTDASAERNAEMIATRLKLVEQALTNQRERDIETRDKANRVLLTITGIFAGLGLLALILASYFQFRTMSRMSEVASAIASPRALTGGDDQHLLLQGNPIEQSTTRLIGAIDRLEKRVFELEHTARPALAAPSTMVPNGNGDHAIDIPTHLPKGEQVTLRLGKGQALLNLNKPEEALACFNEILDDDPNHAEALVKKGTALERLKRLEEAVECYDHAIASNNAMTLAYLYKGGVYNQMERFSEALQCYEQALKTQQKPAALTA